MKKVRAAKEELSSSFNKRYFIFDMDGTLIDSNRMLAEISNRYFQRRGLPPNPEFNLAAKTMNLFQFASAIRTLVGTSEQEEDVLREIRQETEQIYAGEVQAKPYVADFLKKLRKEGAHLCVASATERDCIEMVLHRLDLLDYFEFIITVSDVGNGKSSPDIFLEAARRLGAMAPEDVVVFEDSTRAIKTAKGAGFYVVAVFDEGTLPEELPVQRAFSDRFIDDFSQFL